MDSENYFISKDTSDKINDALRKKKNKVVAVGTSVVRAIETSVMASGMSKQGTGWTDKFIYPPYQFKITEPIEERKGGCTSVTTQTTGWLGLIFAIWGYRKRLQKGCTTSKID
mgnify:CR=1 FL=1